MGRLRERIGIAAEFAERRVDRLLLSIRRRLGTTDGPIIDAYIGYGTPTQIHVKGRVLEQNHIGSPGERDRVWTNMRMMYRRFASAEIPDVRVEASFGGTHVEALTDEEGFFDITLHPAAPTTEYWNKVDLILPDYKVYAQARAVVPQSSAKFGVISDIDDTVVHTDVTSLVKMARITYFGNARTRMPFAGVAAFYRALHQDANPIFYVSSSPWNLFDMLHDFMDLQRIPHGPILLRDWGITATGFLPLSHTDYKLGCIRHILETYPLLPFILVGDSGQHDPEIYLRILREAGERILAIYIRNVRPDRVERVQTIEKLFKEAASAGVSLRLVPDTLAAAEDAAQRGWIDTATVAEIAKETKRDKKAPATELDIVDEKTDR